MPKGTHKDQKEPGVTLLEQVLRLEGDIRRSLEPIRVTPLQAGVMLFLHRHANATLTDAATALRLRLPTMSTLMKALVGKAWVTKRRSVIDNRVVHLSLSRRGTTLTQQIEYRVSHVEATLTERDRKMLGMISQGSRA